MDKSALLTRLGQIVDGHIYADKAALYALTQTPFQSQPANLPLAGVAPAYGAQILEVLQFCQTQNIQIRIRGAGSQICPRHWPQEGDWLILLTSRLDRILEIDTANQLARLQGGASMQHLVKASLEAGFYPCPGVMPENCQTVGGALSVNSSMLSSQVESLVVYSPARGREVYFAQNDLPGNFNTNFPLAPLFCGSYGKLGLICEVTLRLLLKPAEFASLSCVFDAELEAAQTASQLYGQPIVASAFMDKLAAKILKLDGPCLLLKLAGNHEALDRGMEEVSRVVKGNGGRLLTLQKEAVDYWRKYAALPAAFGVTAESCQFLQFNCLPSRLPAFVENTEIICQKYQVKYAIFGDPLRAHCNLMLFAEKNYCHACATELFRLALTLNNLVQNEKDFDLPTDAWLKSDLTGKIAQIFDPCGLLSCHVS